MGTPASAGVGWDRTHGHPRVCSSRGVSGVIFFFFPSPSQPLSHLYLCSALEVEGEHVLAAPRLALPHQEDAVALQPPQLHQLSRFHAGDGPVEPGAGGQELLHLRPRRLRRPPRRRPCPDREAGGG